MARPWDGPKMLQWVKLPSAWVVDDGGLRQFLWRPKHGGHETAALMVLAVIAHHTEGTTGIAKLSYDELTAKVGLSRATVSAALDILSDRGRVDREPEGRGTYGLVDFNPNAGWAKLPAKGLYSGGVVAPFQHFTLRNKNELFAMKLYFLFAAFRDNDSNYAQISYDKITERTKIARENIRGGLSVLAANGLIHIETTPSAAAISGGGQITHNRYRLTHLDSYLHAGTSGRANIADAFADGGG